MGIQARWTTTCDGCGRVHVFEATLTKQNADGNWAHEIQGDVTCNHYDDSAWGPGFPTGWLQVVDDPLIGKGYLFFHDLDCYIDWLTRQGRIEEVLAARDAAPIA